MSTQRGGLVHTECGGGGGGIKRVEGAVWLESAFGRRIAIFVTAEAASTQRRKELPDSSVCFRNGPSIRFSDFRAIAITDSFLQYWIVILLCHHKHMSNYYILEFYSIYHPILPLFPLSLV